MQEELNIGKAIQKIRNDKGFTNQTSFCEKNDLNQSHFSEIENNKKTPTIPYLIRVSKALDVPVFFFFWFIEGKEKGVSLEKEYTYKILEPKISQMLLDIFS